MNSKKLLLVLASVALVGILAFAGFAFFATAASTEKGVRNYVDSFEESPVGPYAELRLASYERGTFSSTCATEFEVGDEGLVLAFAHTIHHGPLMNTPAGFKAGHAYIVTTLDLGASSAQLREWLEPVYGEATPFVLRTQVPLGGDPVFEMDIAPVEHTEDGVALSFDGGEFRFASAGGAIGSAKGFLRLFPLTLRDESDGEGPSIFSADATEINFDIVADQWMKVDGKIGAMRVRSGPETDFSMEIDEIGIDFDFKRADEEVPLMAGTARLSVPKLLFDGGEAGRVSLVGLAYEVTTEVSNGFVESTASYRVAEIDETISQASPLGNVLGSMDGGMGLALSARIPLETARRFHVIAESSGASRFPTVTPDPKAVAALAQGLEEAVRSIVRGTALSADLSLGRSRAEISLSYEGERPITAQKTYQELIDSVRARAAASVPSSMKEIIPEFEENFLGYFVDDGAGALNSEMLLEGGQLLTNGVPNPMLAMMRPVFDTPIDWDSLFVGMRAGLENAYPEAEEEED